MYVQACVAASEYLSFWDRLFIDSQWIGRLEASYHHQTVVVRNSEVAQGRAEHWKPCPAIASHSIQKQSRGVPEASQEFCSTKQTEMKW